MLQAANFLQAGEFMPHCSILESPLRCGAFGTRSDDVEMLRSPQAASSGSDYTVSKLYPSGSTGSFESNFDLTDCASNRHFKKPKTAWETDLSAQFSIDDMPQDNSYPIDNATATTKASRESKKYRTRRTALDAPQGSVETFAPPPPVLSHPSVNSMGVALGMPCFGPVAIPVRQQVWTTTLPPPMLATSTVVNPSTGVVPDLREVLAAKASTLPIGLKLDCAAILKELNSA